jgi:NAD(P)-dependent dehydrogenase (short-subunit alcohol dehydrogenase family)
MAEKKIVLITGVSSGIGQATAQLLAQQGFTVFGTSRNPSRVEKIFGVEVLPLDVRSDESVNGCVDTVVKRTGRLDILVNNAGYSLVGPIEEASLEEAKAQFETNFFGVVRMVKKVLPIMRKQAGGQIINISSGAGVTPLPFVGFYSASKFALEGYTEALRHEVRPFHIRVSLLEPGYIKSHLRQNQQLATDEISDYDPWRKWGSGLRPKWEERLPEPTLVAECVLRIVGSESPRLRYRVGKEATQAFWLRRFLPESLFERGTRRILHLDAKKQAASQRSRQASANTKP